MIACPTCGRIEVDLFTLVQDVRRTLASEITVPMKVAVMGCVVNGPGEAREADLGPVRGAGADHRAGADLDVWPDITPGPDLDIIGPNEGTMRVCSFATSSTANSSRAVSTRSLAPRPEECSEDWLPSDNALAVKASRATGRIAVVAAWSRYVRPVVGVIPPVYE